jgi:hypothetical protein
MLTGWNVTLIVHPWPGANGLEQLLACEKSPLVVMDDMFNGALPVLVNATGCGALEVPTVWAGNFRLAGTRVAVD